MICECKKDGHCPRYGRLMAGRFREICQGVNVDLGTAAAFREQWSREAGVQASAEPPMPILLQCDQAPGDAVAMTAAIYSLHRTHPGRYLTAVESLWPEVFEHNPDVFTGTYQDFAPLRMHYPAIHQSNQRAIHFMQGFCEHLGAALGVQVPLMTNRPHLFFKEEAPPLENYWVVCSGGKDDFTNKIWDGYQQVVSFLKGAVRFVQVGTDTLRQPHLVGAVDMVGKTSLRDLFGWVRRARGVLCGVSLLMHVAAALEKPAVVVAGGREPVAWNAYPRQQYVHTVGVLPCSDIQGNVGHACWRSRVVPLGDGTMLDTDTCERPLRAFGDVPMCMDMISPESVAELVLRYNRQYG